MLQSVGGEARLTSYNDSCVCIHKLETGKKHPNVEHALKLAKLFNVTLDQLLDDEVELE